MARNQAVDSESKGLVHNFLDLSTSVAGQALGVGFGLADDVIAETRKCVGLSIDLMESIAQSLVRVARSANGRVGELLADTSARALSSGQSMVRLFQLGGDHVTAL